MLLCEFNRVVKLPRSEWVGIEYRGCEWSVLFQCMCIDLGQILHQAGIFYRVCVEGE